MRNHLLPLFFAAALLLLLTTGCGRRAADLEMTPVAGGMAAPAEDIAAVGEATSAPSDSQPAPAATPVVLAPGVAIVLIAPSDTPLRADAAADALVFQSYAPGERMVIVEPSGEYAGYPVVNGGQEWYRVRAADGLVGWLPADVIAAAR